MNKANNILTNNARISTSSWNYTAKESCMDVSVTWKILFGNGEVKIYVNAVILLHNHIQF